MSQETISIIALPPGEIGTQLSKTFRLWHRFGLIEDGLVVQAEQLNVENVKNFEVEATLISDAETYFPLFQFLGETAYTRRDLIVPWYLGDSEPNLELATVGAMLADKIRMSISRLRSSKTQNEVFFSTLLAVPSYQETKPDDMRSGDFYFQKYELIALASSEIKASPGASSIPVKEGWSSFIPFVSAQIITAAGLWKGNPYPLSNIVGRLNSPLRQGEGKVIVFRSMTSAVVARNLARKMVSKALIDAANPELNPFQGGDNRPRSLEDSSIDFLNPYFEPEIELVKASAIERLDEDQAISSDELSPDPESKNQQKQKDKKSKQSSDKRSDLPKVQSKPSDQNIIDKSINDVAGKIMEGFEETFNYERRPKLEHQDFKRGPKAVLKYFWDFSVATFKSMPYYTRLWFERKNAKILDKVFGHVSQVKEKYFGLEQDLMNKINRIGDLRTESRRLDNLVLASTVFQENSRLWKNLRSYAYSALDLKIDDQVGQENRVFPHFKYIASDPDARYRFDEAIALLLEVSPEVNFDQAHQARVKLLECLNSNTNEIQDLKKKIEKMRNPIPDSAGEITEAQPEEISSNGVPSSKVDEDPLAPGAEVFPGAQFPTDADNVTIEHDLLPQIDFEERPEDSTLIEHPEDFGIIQDEQPEEAIVHAPIESDSQSWSQSDSMEEAVLDTDTEDDSLSRFLDFGEEEDRK